MSIRISQRAAQKVQQGLQKQGMQGGGLRLGVKGGGCSGFSYVIRYESDKKPIDKVFKEHGVKVFVDLKSYLYLKGMLLDWKGSFMQQGFTFSNPNAAKTCSCGQSFIV